MNVLEIIEAYLNQTLLDLPHPVQVFSTWRDRVRACHERLRETKAVWTDHHANRYALLLDVDDYLTDVVKRYPKPLPSHDQVADELPA